MQRARQASTTEVATYNDCHTPHNFDGKYVRKASNGFGHSFYFTTGRFPDPLRITEGNSEVTEDTCRLPRRNRGGRSIPPRVMPRLCFSRAPTCGAASS